MRRNFLEQVLPSVEIDMPLPEEESVKEESLDENKKCIVEIAN
jgi:hypothetical protein